MAYEERRTRVRIRAYLEHRQHDMDQFDGGARYLECQRSTSWDKTNIDQINGLETYSSNARKCWWRHITFVSVLFQPSLMNRYVMAQGAQEYLRCNHLVHGSGKSCCFMYIVPPWITSYMPTNRKMFLDKNMWIRIMMIVQYIKSSLKFVMPHSKQRIIHPCQTWHALGLVDMFPCSHCLDTQVSP